MSTESCAMFFLPSRAVLSATLREGGLTVDLEITPIFG